jgi:hypothetical protein
LLLVRKYGQVSATPAAPVAPPASSAVVPQQAATPTNAPVAS